MLSPSLPPSLQGRTNLPPDKVPWSALRTLLSQCIYGGRIDNDFDQRLLNSFVNRLFTVKSFNSEFPLMEGIDGDSKKNIAIPEGIRYPTSFCVCVCVCLLLCAYVYDYYTTCFLVCCFCLRVLAVCYIAHRVCLVCVPVHDYTNLLFSLWKIRCSYHLWFFQT